MQPMSDFNQPQFAQKKRFPWGCLLGGCLTVFLIMVIGTGTAGYMGYRYYVGQVNKYTSTEPADIPKIEKSKEESEAVQKRFEDFKDALTKNESPPPLVLTADEINALISNNKDLKGRLYVSIADGAISAQASIPAEMIPGGKGRYFNGRVSLKASLENGVLIVTLDDAEVNGEPLPAQILDAIRNENLAKDAYKDAKSAEFLRKFERLTIENDKIILTPAPLKKNAPIESSNPPEPATSTGT
jgi:hypothetical protein